jgi:serine-type D-Ala-D-Ala carboxypeptidase/endopeptidase (penicillin-binding protein 4)
MLCSTRRHTLAIQPFGKHFTALLVSVCFAACAAAAERFPADLEAAFQRARVPTEAVSVLVQEVGAARPLVALNTRAPMNPASVIKLVTTAAALDQLGPAWSWATPVWLQGKLQDGVLDGAMVIKGSGDPKLVMERVWLLLRRVQQLGVREIRGDIVLDSSAFAVPESAPGEFDGESIRAYNVRSAALLFNYKASIYTFVPDAARGIAVVASEPALAGQQVDRSVPLSAGPCDDWAGALKASFSATRVRFGGSYPNACGEQTWALADPAPGSYNQRFIEGLWREMGGKLSGSVREGTAPADVKPSFEHRSPPLVEVVREINKFSNNVMAQQLFLTLALARQPSQAATPDSARDNLKRWWSERVGELPAELVIDNGSGLSRETRISAASLGVLLQSAWASPWMPELMGSLPITGVDGTMRRSRAGVGRAHLKTGSLKDVAARAGYVLAPNGKRYVLVVMVNHPGAMAARPAMDAVVQWVMNYKESPKDAGRAHSSDPSSVVPNR